jgi:hypothetical protein
MPTDNYYLIVSLLTAIAIFGMFGYSLGFRILLEEATKGHLPEEQLAPSNWRQRVLEH